MKYAKLINNTPVYAQNPILHNGRRIGNPPGEVYEAEGYKPVVYSDFPGEAPAGFQWVDTWSEEDGNIQQGWVLEQIPITEEDALTNYSNKLSGKEDENLPAATETLIKMVKEG